MLNLEYNCIQYIEQRLIKEYKSKIKEKTYIKTIGI